MVVEQTIQLLNETGMHLRPAMMLANLASSFESTISVAKVGQPPAADAKSIISLLTLGAEKGSRLTICAKGQDAEQALAALVALIAGGFSAG
jgi:phosphotransferase system HPr (HPr) family protein